MNKIIVNILIFISLLFLATPVLAQSIPNFLNATSFCQLLTDIATGVGTIVGSLGVLMVIIAGIYYLTSAGNPQRMGTAKTALLYAIIGMVVGLAAGAIVASIKEIVGAAGGAC